VTPRTSLRLVLRQRAVFKGGGEPGNLVSLRAYELGIFPSPEGYMEEIIGIVTPRTTDLYKICSYFPYISSYFPKIFPSPTTYTEGRDQNFSKSQSCIQRLAPRSRFHECDVIKGGGLVPSYGDVIFPRISFIYPSYFDMFNVFTEPPPFNF